MEVKIQAVFLDKTSSKKNYNEDGVIFVYEEEPLTLDVFGTNLQKIKKLKFTLKLMVNDQNSSQKLVAFTLISEFIGIMHLRKFQLNDIHKYFQGF